jgi:hypothetical protein
MGTNKIPMESLLAEYVKKFKIRGKGPLSVVLVLTRRAKDMIPPFKYTQFLTKRGGQVAGLGGAAVQRILKEYGIERKLAEEGGRTSRGSINNMHGYLKLLNELNRNRLLDLEKTEKWWIQRIREFFASQPLKIKNDQSRSLASLINDLISIAYKRQKEQQGTMVAGAVMQHLVGAKLDIALPDIPIEHKGFSVADEQRGGKGDFLISDSVIHVTTAPTDALIRKCGQNLREGLRPIIITTDEGIGGAKALAKNSESGERIEVFEISQFIAANVYEWSRFRQSDRPLKINDLIDSYNRIIDSVETDPSLRIAIG